MDGWGSAHTKTMTSKRFWNHTAAETAPGPNGHTHIGTQHLQLPASVPLSRAPLETQRDCGKWREYVTLKNNKLGEKRVKGK